MNIVKVMNNSLLLVTDEEGKELIVMGKGIGFKMKAGDKVDTSKIEKVYVPQNEKLTSEYLQLMVDTPSEYIEVVNYIVDYAKVKLDVKLSSQLFFTLLDHITYAISRIKSNIIIQNRLIWEVKRFYSKEFKIGLHAVEYINRRLNIELPEEEAANIAFHLVNAQLEDGTMERTIYTVRILKDIFSIVQYNFNININEDSINHIRFITHLQFFVQRLFDDKLNESKDNFIFEQVKKQYPKEFNCARLIGDYVEKSFDKKIGNEELLYLTIHIVRLIER
ncbi:PRD domain-containing protein [Clostridium sp. MSJ-8]|uniref:BglG family transcription antiterminator LicT n=1 Tax=Clostridium sp. MSJ-8 TaxID=2841510 RepID=UPI001C0E9631|nr:PRD domain-containing protein [Clostridium sp. MSJ-8]MBU5488086.1 PRD domain-containing protein [Clostridium sp. MSJ-8]